MGWAVVGLGERNGVGTLRFSMGEVGKGGRESTVGAIPENKEDN
jgi:hypothetical protein